MKDWGIDVGTNVVVDVSGMGQLLGTDVSVPVAAKYDPHPITERFNLLTAYPLARSVTAIAGGANGRNAQNLVETSRNSWAETDIKRLTTSGQVARELDKGDKAGPVSLAAAVSAPAARRARAGRRSEGRRPPDAPSRNRASRCSATPISSSTDILGIPGQPRPVPEHGQLARAAGEPDLDPARATRRTAASR